MRQETEFRNSYSTNVFIESSISAKSEISVTGIVIFTAGREDAYQDFLESVKEGFEPDRIDEHLPADFSAPVEDGDTGRIRLWGTSAEHKWRQVEAGDIVLIYRDGAYIAQAKVLSLHQNQELAQDLYDREGNPWDPESPWEYLVFVTDVEDIDIEVERFNNLVDYEPTYRPQGFTRVADDRIERLEAEYDSVETAVNDLTGSGPLVHEVDDDDDTDESLTTDQLGEQLITASQNGGEPTAFEKLVATGFSRLGFEARWIEGGDDTDVELTSPVHAIVEVKARSSGTLQSPDASRIRGHRESRGANHAVVVAPGFTPAAIDDANRDGLVLLSAGRLRDLIERHDRYGFTPETIAEHLFEPGAFQDDRLDQLDDILQARQDAAESLLAVIQALELKGDGAHSARDLQNVLIGLRTTESAPSTQFIEESLTLLAHPTIGIIDRGDDGYQLTTTPEQAEDLLTRFGALIDAARNTES